MSGDSLRPTSFDEYIGQRAAIREIDVRIRAARAYGKPLVHILLVGPAGSGKTSLAQIIGVELGEETEVLSCPVNLKVLARTIRTHSGLLVLDEIHRFARSGLESLLTLLEPPTEGRLPYLGMPNGERVEAEWLSVIGTTTERQKIIKPLWDRFDSKPNFTPYTQDDLCYIVAGMAVKQGLDLDDAGLNLFARAALGTPRVARQLVVAYHSMITVAEDEGEPRPEPVEALSLLQLEEDGLSVDHIKYMETLDLLGGTKGLGLISKLLQLDESIVEELELLLLERGYLQFTNQGRELLTPAYTRLKEYRTNNDGSVI